MEFKVFNIKLKLSSNNPLYMYIIFALINMECPYSVKTSLSVHADNYHSEKWFCDVFFLRKLKTCENSTAHALLKLE